LAVGILFAGRKRTPDALLVDGTLVFGVPIAGFALQAALVKDTPNGLAWSAVVCGAFYIGADGSSLNARGEAQLLVEAFFAIGVCFLTLAVPLALDGRWTAAVWALEELRFMEWRPTRPPHSRYMGLALQLMAGFSFLFTETASRGDRGIQRVLHGDDRACPLGPARCLLS